MSLNIDTTDWVTGALSIGNTGFGVLGSAIPSSGDSGAGYAYNDLTLPADNNKEICGRVASWPSAGVLFPNEDTSFTYTAGADGTYVFSYQLYVDGIATGPVVDVLLAVGTIAGSASGAPNQITLTAAIANGFGTEAGSGYASGSPANFVLSVPSANANGTVGVVTLTSDDVAWIVSTIMNQPQLLTLAKFLALK